MVNKSSNFILHGFSYFTILIKLARFLNNMVFCWNQKQCYMRPSCFENRVLTKATEGKNSFDDESCKSPMLLSLKLVSGW